jgi:hypothetical protein
MLDTGNIQQREAVTCSTDFSARMAVAITAAEKPAMSKSGSAPANHHGSSQKGWYQTVTAGQVWHCIIYQVSTGGLSRNSSTCGNDDANDDRQQSSVHDASFTFAHHCNSQDRCEHWCGGADCLRNASWHGCEFGRGVCVRILISLIA